MATDAAIRSALELLMLPTRVRAARAEALPSGVDDLLRVVAGEAALIEQFAQVTGRPAETLHLAAAFYVEQVMLHPDADHYRNLGSDREASIHELRRRMAWLMAWLHPDKGVSTARQALALRVMDAWQTLSNDERRASYDVGLLLKTSAATPSSGRSGRLNENGARRYAVPSASKRRRFLNGLKAFMLGQRPPLA